MKKLFAVILSVLLCFSATAEITWLSKKGIRNMCDGKDLGILAMITCDTQEEVERVCGIEDLDTCYVHTKFSGLKNVDMYIITVTDKIDYRLVEVCHYMEDGTADVYEWILADL